MSVVEITLPAKKSRSKKSKFINCWAPLFKLKMDRHEEKICIYETTKYALVYGGCGALGAKCIYELKTHSWWVASVDYTANTHADMNIMVADTDSAENQEQDVIKALTAMFEKNHKLDLILCAAGGFCMGTVKDNLVYAGENMWKRNVIPAIICATIAAKYMCSNGLFILSGAKACLQPTPGMLGYGTAKAAIIHFAKSLAADGSGMPEDSRIITLLPEILDTTQNRKTLHNADIGTFTPLQFVSDLILRWTSGKDIPPSGTFCQLTTHNFTTDIIRISN